MSGEYQEYAILTPSGNNIVGTDSKKLFTLGGAERRADQLDSLFGEGHKIVKVLGISDFMAHRGKYEGVFK